MSAQAELPKGHPMRDAWETYSATDKYANTRRWALTEAHVDGSLWAAFIAGYGAALPAVPEVKEAAFGDQPMSLRERIWTMELEAGSLRAVATKTGVDVGYLSRLKSGEKINPSDDTLSKLGLVRRVGYALAAASAHDQTEGGGAI